MRGWVSRQSCLADKRGVELVLTPAGLTATHDIARLHVQSVRDNLVDIMTPAQFRAMGEGMSIVRDHLDPAGLSGR
jgi:DNA-binding MarR family transcriptional regulator